MSDISWPDPIRRAEPARAQELLSRFWLSLHELADLIEHEQDLLASRQIDALRGIVTEMMLAMNGITYPTGTRRLNAYLGESQRVALVKTLRVSEPGRGAWIGCAVSLLVIYRWYAPQLVERYGLVYPQALEETTLAELAARLPEWPVEVRTDGG